MFAFFCCISGLAVWIVGMTKRHLALPLTVVFVLGMTWLADWISTAHALVPTVGTQGQSIRQESNTTHGRVMYFGSQGMGRSHMGGGLSGGK